MSKKSTEGPSSSNNGATEKTPLVSREGEELGEDGKPLGLSVHQTTLLIAGELAGSGVLALPRALVKTGWTGVFIMIVMCGIAAFSGKRLGDCWTLLEARDPAMRTRKRNPYAIIAAQAMGPRWGAFVSCCVLVTLFGAAVVYLLMAAQIVEEVLLSLFPSISYCTWFLLVAGAMTPLMMLGTPRDFSMMGGVALLSTLVACGLYFVQILLDAKPFPVFRYGMHGFQDFFLAFGTILFAFGGASTFPTIQNDMADKTQFSKSVFYSFLGILGLYLPISIAAYAVYGELVAPNFATSLSATPITLAANVFMAFHLVSAFIIIVNPVCQEAEEMYDVPRDSLKWRLGIRLSIMVAILMVGETIPRFHTLLALVGSSTVALLTFVLPSYCYMKLADQTSAGQSPIPQPGWVRMVCWEVMLVGILGGAASFFAALNAIFNTAPATPCYLK